MLTATRDPVADHPHGAPLAIAPRFRAKAAVADGQQVDHLAFGNVDANARDSVHPPRHLSLSLMILGQHETALPWSAD